MSTPAPASLYVPRSKRLPGKPVAKRATVEAPAAEHQVSIELLLARVTIRGVAGVSSAAVAEYVAILQRDLAGAARLVRLNAPTLPAPAPVDVSDEVIEACLSDYPSSICDAVERVLEDEEHDPSTCTDPCCVPEDDDLSTYCADEGHVVLSDARGFYGVSSGGAW